MDRAARGEVEAARRSVPPVKNDAHAYVAPLIYTLYRDRGEPCHSSQCIVRPVSQRGVHARSVRGAAPLSSLCDRSVCIMSRGRRRRRERSRGWLAGHALFSRVPGASLESARRVMSHVHMYMHVGPVSSDHRVALTLFSPSHVDVALHSRHVIQTDPRLSPPVATTSHTHRCVLMHDRRRVQAALATCRHAAHERGRASRLNSCPRAATLHRPCAGCSAHNSHPLPPASSPCPPSPRSQAVAHLLDAGDNVVDLREGVDLQVGGVRHRDVCAGDPLDGRVEVVERLRLVDARAYT